MSLWHTKLRCKNCDSEITVQGGMVNDMSMYTPNEEVVCPNENCRLVGYKNFFQDPNHKTYHDENGNVITVWYE